MEKEKEKEKKILKSSQVRKGREYFISEHYRFYYREPRICHQLFYMRDSPPL